ncbi:hypothetical protein NV379_22215 [Paenibacillus sp. N1-5-1-14]|uniref:hypothetical protein n=1 Tax=Paenibacillus radicibacter TaxID=2972488 RepID=UPI00215981ED|nr:hypothetical protein [Paenibacillus radicibacter]MCR8645359.1 hypothetical protein [Paenibacillus radicibacter]
MASLRKSVIIIYLFKLFRTSDATYLKDVPTGGNNGWLLAASILFGALIGLASVERDDKGKTYVTTGIASVASGKGKRLVKLRY